MAKRKQRNMSDAWLMHNAYTPTLCFERVITPEIAREVGACERALQLIKEAEYFPNHDMPDARFHVILHIAEIYDDIFDTYKHPNTHRAIFMKDCMWHSEDGKIK